METLYLLGTCEHCIHQDTCKHVATRKKIAKSIINSCDIEDVPTIFKIKFYCQTKKENINANILF